MTAPLADELSPLLLSNSEAAAISVHGGTDAAVLVALYRHAGELHTVLTRRREDLSRHAGEISFPGGRRDPGEDDLRVTALREAEEEIGLPRAAVTLAGALRPTPTMVTGYAIHPFVGAIEAGHRWRPSAAEVAEVLDLPLSAVRAGHERRRLVRHGIAFQAEVYAVGDALIWGATARILGDLLERTAPLLDADAECDGAA